MHTAGMTGDHGKWWSARGAQAWEAMPLTPPESPTIPDPPPPSADRAAQAEAKPVAAHRRPRLPVDTQPRQRPTQDAKEAP